MTELVDVKSIVEQYLKLECETKIENGVLYIRINGIDNVSLAKYILEECKELKVTVKEREGYKFSDLGWVQVEKSYINELVYTRS